MPRIDLRYSKQRQKLIKKIEAGGWARFLRTSPGKFWKLWPADMDIPSVLLEQSEDLGGPCEGTRPLRMWQWPGLRDILARSGFRTCA